jgi:hypothetical protein
MTRKVFLLINGCGFGFIGLAFAWDHHAYFSWPHGDYRDSATQL